MKQLILHVKIVTILVINVLHQTLFVWDVLIIQYLKELLLQLQIPVHAILAIFLCMIQQQIVLFVIIHVLPAHSRLPNAYLVMLMFWEVGILLHNLVHVTQDIMIILNQTPNVILVLLLVKIAPLLLMELNVHPVFQDYLEHWMELIVIVWQVIMII